MAPDPIADCTCECIPKPPDGHEYGDIHLQSQPKKAEAKVLPPIGCHDDNVLGHARNQQKPLCLIGNYRIFQWLI